MRKCGSREGAIGAIDPLKPSKLCLFTIILCNSEINVSDSMTLKYVIFLKSPPSPLTLPAGSCDCGPQTFTTGHAQVLLKLRTFLKLNLSIKNVDTAAFVLQTSWYALFRHYVLEFAAWKLPHNLITKEA